MIRLVSAPSNLGLRPPEPGGVPGAAKAPEALRAAGLWDRLPGAGDGGLVLPGRYVDDGRRPAGTVRNEAALLDHGRRLGARVRAVLDAGDVPVVVGGDCSILLGAGLGVRGLGAGLVHVDGHTDFRHPGTDEQCGSLAGEDLAAAVGLHWPAVADLDGRGPLFPAARAAHIGCREDDAHVAEARSVLGLVAPARDVLLQGAGRVADLAIRTVGEGFWLQVDVDVLDPAVMPAVDSPAPGGLTLDDLRDLLLGLVPAACGLSVTVFDPDLDPDGQHASRLAGVLVDGLAGLGSGGRRSLGDR